MPAGHEPGAWSRSRRGARTAWAVFRGQFQHTLDDKGRVILPARFRDALSSDVVLTRGFDHCVDVWPQAEYDRKVEQSRRLPRERRVNRAYRRMLTASAHDHTLDSQGRLVVPAHLREYAGLDRDLVVNGDDEKIEIWDRERWEAYTAENEAEIASMDLDLDDLQ